MLTDVLDEPGEGVAATLRERGIEAAYRHLDVADADEWDAAVGFAEESFGPLDVLVNNAGIVSFAGVAELPTPSGTGSWPSTRPGSSLGMRTAAASMRRAGGGSIVNKASIYGLDGVPGLLRLPGEQGRGGADDARRGG